MTKIEKIENLFDFCSEEGHRANYPADFEDFSKDIDNLIKETAISFAEWIDGNNYECFLMTDEGVKHWEVPPGRGNLTTAQLYTLYLEHINKQK